MLPCSKRSEYTDVMSALRVVLAYLFMEIMEIAVSMSYSPRVGSKSDFYYIHLKHSSYITHKNNISHLGVNDKKCISTESNL